MELPRKWRTGIAGHFARSIVAHRSDKPTRARRCATETPRARCA
jgi:hypothetical protein